MADQVRDEQQLSMSMFVNPADYWQAMYERRETEAHQLSEQIIRLRASHVAEVAPTEFTRRTAELLAKVPVPPNAITYSLGVKLLNELQQLAVDMRAAHSALKGDKP